MMSQCCLWVDGCLGEIHNPKSSFCLFVPKVFRCSYKIVLFMCTVGTLLHLLSSYVEGNGSTKYLKAFFTFPQLQTFNPIIPSIVQFSLTVLF